MNQKHLYLFENIAAAFLKMYVHLVAINSGYGNYDYNDNRNYNEYDNMIPADYNTPGCVVEETKPVPDSEHQYIQCVNGTIWIQRERAWGTLFKAGMGEDTKEKHETETAHLLLKE